MIYLTSASCVRHYYHDHFTGGNRSPGIHDKQTKEVKREKNEPKSSKSIENLGQVVVAHAFIPALGRQRQVDLCEFEASLVYKASS